MQDDNCLKSTFKKKKKKKKQRGGYFESSHQIIRQGLDPTEGFNIKTNFPKMENKKMSKDKSTKKTSHILNKTKATFFFIDDYGKIKFATVLYGLVPLRFNNPLAVVFLVPH